MADKKEQTARGMRGQSIVRSARLDEGKPFVRVPLDPATAQGEYPIRVNIAPETPRQARIRAATEVGNKPEGFSEAFGGPVVRALSPLLSNLADGLSMVPGLATQDGRVRARDGYDKLVGNPYGGEKVPLQPESPVEQAMAQGRAAGPVTEMAPADRQSQLLAAILGSGLTVNEAATIAGTMPANAASKIPSAKDNVMGQASKLSEALFQNQINQATELAKTDPDGAKAVVEKATAEHFQRQAGLVGFNPLQLAQAQLMDEAE